MQPYGPISLLPSAQVLNYGQAIFEGMKAQRTESGSIVVFRPTCNAERMRNGAERMSMQAPPEDLFVKVRCSTAPARTRACVLATHVTLSLHSSWPRACRVRRLAALLSPGTRSHKVVVRLCCVLGFITRRHA